LTSGAPGKLVRAAFTGHAEDGITTHERRRDLHGSPPAGAGERRAPEFELIRSETDHPDLAHWHGNVGHPVALDLAPPMDAAPEGVDVLSWNIAVGTGRLHEVLERLRGGEWGGAGADPRRPLVILAQEAYRAGESVPERPATRHHGGWIVRGGQCDVVEVAYELGLSLRYAPSMRNGDERSDRGNAVLSTAALAGSHAFTLPFVRQRRVAVAAEVEGLEGIAFVSAHLDTWGRPPEDRGWRWRFGAGRAAQASHLARRIIHAEGKRGVVIGADLNTPLGTRDPAVRALVRAGFTPAARQGSWGYSFRGPVKLLLDHVLYHAAASRLRSVSVTRLDAEGGGGKRVFGSDHHPLLARVSLHLA
jgi:endonuclease/exonuclease/phosphatase family metal-dependent hydrolase